MAFFTALAQEKNQEGWAEMSIPLQVEAPLKRLFTSQPWWKEVAEDFRRVEVLRELPRFPGCDAFLEEVRNTTIVFFALDGIKVASEEIGRLFSAALLLTKMMGFPTAVCSFDGYVCFDNDDTGIRRFELDHRYGIVERRGWFSYEDDDPDTGESCFQEEEVHYRTPLLSASPAFLQAAQQAIAVNKAASR